MPCYAAYAETAIVDSETVVTVAENIAFGVVQVPAETSAGSVPAYHLVETWCSVLVLLGMVIASSVAEHEVAVDVDVVEEFASFSVSGAAAVSAAEVMVYSSCLY